MTKFRIPALLLLIAPVLCAAALMSLAPGGPAGAAADSGTGAIADAEGALRVPADYRSAYQYLGTWAVAADPGEGSKQLHNVYASPGAVAAFRANGHFPDGAILVKEVYATATGPMTTGTVSHADTLAGWFVMVKDSKNSHPQQALGQRMGLVMVRRQGSLEDDIDRLQDGLPALSYSGAGDGLDLHPGLSDSAQVRRVQPDLLPGAGPLTNPCAPRDQSHPPRAVNSCPCPGMMTTGKSAGPRAAAGRPRGNVHMAHRFVRPSILAFAAALASAAARLGGPRRRLLG